MAHSKSQGWGCLPMFLLWTFMLMAGAFGSVNSDDGHPLLVLVIFTIIGITIEVSISKSQSKRPMTEKIKSAESEAREKRKQYIKHLDGVTYIGGYESISTQMNGNIGLKKKGIIFYIDGVIGGNEEDNGWVADAINEMFTIPFENITNIIYDTTENITLGRVIAIGVFAALLKKKNNYFVVEYINEANVKNTVIFGTGSKKNQEFLNEAIVLKNANARENKPKVKNQIIENNLTDKIRELAKLKDEGILTEEEFSSKKKELLSKI